MQRVVEILILLTALSAGCGSESPEGERTIPSLEVQLEPDSAGLGDPVTLRIEAALPDAVRPLSSAESESIGAWTVLRTGSWKQTDRGDWSIWIREVSLTGLRLGFLGPDSLRIRAIAVSGETLSLAVEAPALQVGGEIAEGGAVDATGARDIRDVFSLGSPIWPWVLSGGGLLLVAAGIYLRGRRKRRRAMAVTEPARPSPREEFEQAIARLLHSGMLERGLYREFYYEISRAVRLYLERVHDLPVLESTSDEVLRLLAPRIDNAQERTTLGDWLREGDLVKYARMERLQSEAQRYLERSRRLVDSLLPPMEEKEPSSGTPSPEIEIAGGSAP